MTTFPAFRILHPTIRNIFRPQPGKLLDARAFEWIDAVVWGMGGAFFGLFRHGIFRMLPDQATKGYPLWCLGKILRRPLLLLRESVSGPRTIKTKLSTMTTFPALRILHPTI